MNKYRPISLDKLVKLIANYTSGETKQERPAIVWFDNAEGELLRYTPYGDVAGFASSLSHSNKHIAYWDTAGSPLTDRNLALDSNHVVGRLSDKERMQFVLPPVINDDTRVFLHTIPSSIVNIGERGLNSIEYGILLHDHEKLAVFHLYPLAWKNQITEDLSGYDEYLCACTIEEEKSRWFERVSKQQNGLQVVDNFYLDFLKQAPVEFVSYKFDPHSCLCAVCCDYSRWQYANQNLLREIKHLISEAEYQDVSSIESLTLFVNGNLDFNQLEQIVDEMTDESWNAWFESHKYLIDDHNLRDSVNHKRIDILKGFFCSYHMGQTTQESLQALMKFHNLC